MAIVINGTGSIAGLSVGGLPDDSVDEGSLANSINTSIAAKLPLSGGALTGAVTTNSTIDGRDVAADGVLATNAMPKSGGAFTGNVTTNGLIDTRDVAADGVLATNALPKAGGTMTGMIVGSGTSNTAGAASALRLGESNFRIMTGGESHVLCLDRDNNGGTKKIMQSWNPDNGTVAIGSAAPVAAGMLMIKPTSLTQAQIKLQGLNYSFGAEIMSQNGSESGTVGNTRCWYKLDLVTNGNVRRMHTASSQIGTDYQAWFTNNSEVMRIVQNGSFRVCMENGGADASTSNYGFAINQNGTDPFVQHFTNGTGNTTVYVFGNDNGVVGNIRTNGSATAFNTSSDYRLKENVDYTWDATTRLKQLKPARFNFIADANTTVDGFLAHEVSSVVPEAITGTHNGMKDEEYETTAAVKNENDDITTPAVMGTRSVADYQSIDQSKLVPLLVKTIQELEARITALEA
tara:strand:+ start:91 stop:1473 length:1383 start_codon:yes stop_codon:yes gene_type:complete